MTAECAIAIAVKLSWWITGAKGFYMRIPEGIEARGYGNRVGWTEVDPEAFGGQKLRMVALKCGRRPPIVVSEH